MFAPSQSQNNNLANNKSNNDNEGFCLDANQNVFVRVKCDFCDNDAKFACAR